MTGVLSDGTAKGFFRRGEGPTNVEDKNQLLLPKIGAERGDRQDPLERESLVEVLGQGREAA